MEVSRLAGEEKKRVSNEKLGVGGNTSCSLEEPRQHNWNFDTGGK